MLFLDVQRYAIDRQKMGRASRKRRSEKLSADGRREVLSRSSRVASQLPHGDDLIHLTPYVLSASSIMSTSVNTIS